MSTSPNLTVYTLTAPGKYVCKVYIINGPVDQASDEVNKGIPCACITANVIIVAINVIL